MPAGALICCAARAPPRPVCSSAPQPPQPRAAGWRAPWRAARAAERPAATQTTEEQQGQELQPDLDIEAPSPSGSKVTSLGNLSTLANKLLMNAASLRAVRGQTHCTHCRGTGRETCPDCQGSGILSPEKVRMMQVKKAGRPRSDSDWQLTNRCSRCRGTGALPCKHCGGSGRLGPEQ